MTDQGKTVITMTVPASSAYKTAVSGAGTKSATLKAIGFMDDSTGAGVTTGPVQIAGTTLAIAGAQISAAGTSLKSDANGKLVAATVGSGDEYHLICAIALETAAADGVMFAVKIV